MSQNQPTFEIRGQRVGTVEQCYIIAEIGHNHQGDFELCRALFRAAKEAGANAVKLQKRSNRRLYTKDFFESPYESPNAFGKTYGAHREALEFGRDEYIALQEYASELNITFIATPFDAESVDFLAELGIPAMKIASGDLRNIPLLRQVASVGVPVLLSTGGGTLAEVETAIATVQALNPQIAVLQCTSAYPMRDEDAHLAVIEAYRELFPEVVVGYSGHDIGSALSLFALGLGARIIEKHFTLDKALKGTDHRMSLTPPELAHLVEEARRFHAAYGLKSKRLLQIEEAAIAKMGKKIVAARAIEAQARFSSSDLELRSPGDGLSPDQLDAIIGQRARRTIKQGEPLSWELVDRDD